MVDGRRRPSTAIPARSNLVHQVHVANQVPGVLFRLLFHNRLFTGYGNLPRSTYTHQHSLLVDQPDDDAGQPPSLSGGGVVTMEEEGLLEYDLQLLKFGVQLPADSVGAGVLQGPGQSTP